jgi:CheY-like chemotaxis protein
MSLVGNLEDLGLGEILQIVSLSRRSGVLSLESRGRQARVIFRNGQVIRATSSALQRNMGEVLIQRGVIDLPLLRRALSLQAQEGHSQLLGCIMIERFGVSADAIEEVVREQIENVVYSLFVWAEGVFEFDLQEVPEVDAAAIDPVQFMLRQGLNPQYLAMEGSRMVDELRHRGQSGEDLFQTASDESLDFDFNLLQEPAAEHAPQQGAARTESPPAEPSWQPAPFGAGGQLVLVDDDPLTLETLASLLEQYGYRVHALAKSEDVLQLLDTMHRNGLRPAVLVDLIMPRMDGTGILGGLELMELVHDRFPELRLLALSDFPNEDARQKLDGAGVRLIMKPLKSEICEAIHDFAPTLIGEISRLYESEGAAAEDLVNLGDELRLELGEDAAPPGHDDGSELGRSHLKGMLEELNNQHLGGGIMLLVLRYAAEFLNRGVVLLVKKDAIQGLGQFGLEDHDGGADFRVGKLSIPRGEPSFFASVIESRFTLKGRADDSDWSGFFLDQLGTERPPEVFVGPIVSEGKVVALLYGDNLPEIRPIGDTDSLEIFLGQAGIAMEKALLQRRLQDRGRGEL